MVARLCAAALALVIVSLAGCGLPPSSLVTKPQPKLLAFTATWCPACQADKPLLRAVAHAGYRVVEIDADRQPETLKAYGIASLPSYIVLRGAATYRAKDIHDALKELQEYAANDRAASNR